MPIPSYPNSLASPCWQSWTLVFASWVWDKYSAFHSRKNPDGPLTHSSRPHSQKWSAVFKPLQSIWRCSWLGRWSFLFYQACTRLLQVIEVVDANIGLSTIVSLWDTLGWHEESFEIMKILCSLFLTLISNLALFGTGQNSFLGEMIPERSWRSSSQERCSLNKSWFLFYACSGTLKKK